MDPHKTGALNQPPPAHNVTPPTQYPPTQGLPMAQAVPAGYNLPKPAHTGSSMGMTKSPQGQALQSGVPPKQAANMPEKNYPMMPPKCGTPPNHSPNIASGMPKMPQVPSVSSKAGCMVQPQQSYQQFQQRMNPQHHFQAQQNMPMHMNQSQLNAHNMPPYPQVQSQKVHLSSQNIPMNKPELSKGTTPPIPDLISMTKPVTTQPLPPSSVKPDSMIQCQQVSAKPLQNIAPIPKEASKVNSNMEIASATIPSQTVQMSSDNKSFGSNIAAAKPMQNQPKAEANKFSVSAPEPASNLKRPEVMDTNESQEQIVSDKSIPSIGLSLNGVASKPSAKVGPPYTPKISESTDAKSVGESSKKPPPTQQPMTATKNVTTPLPKLSPSTGVTLTKAPAAMQVKPAVVATSVSISKSSQPMTKPVVTPKTIGAQPTFQSLPAGLQVTPPKAVAGTATKSGLFTGSAIPSHPTVQADIHGNNKPPDSVKIDTAISQTKTLEVASSKSETVPLKTDNTGLPKGAKVDNVSSKPEISAAKLSKQEPSSAKLSKIETSPIKSSKVESMPARTAKVEVPPTKPSKVEISPAKCSKVEVSSTKPKVESSPAKLSKGESLPTKPQKAESPKPLKEPVARIPRRNDTSPKMPKENKAEAKKPQRPARTQATPKATAEGERKSKRTRLVTPVYQSPAIEAAIRIPKSLVASPSTQEKLICFFKNEHLAVRNPDGAFYICQLAQNVYRSTRKLKIRWLSPNDETDTCEIFKPDYYDTTDFDCILTSISLEKVDRTTFRLPPVERERILNILQRALDKEQGIDTSKDDFVEDHPDGLDISLYKDEAQLKNKKSKRSLRTKRAQSEETTDEDSEEMKDLGDDSDDDDKDDKIEEPSEEEESDDDDKEGDSESEEEPAPSPPRKTTALTTRRGAPRTTAGTPVAAAVTASKPAVKKPAVRTPATRNKRSAAVADIAETSAPAPPAKVARTLRQPAKTTPAPKQQSKPVPKTAVGRRTRK